ncbi:hypothetical protein ACWEJ6_52320 [Nonomuraea sp. NPDC004702]
MLTLRELSVDRHLLETYSLQLKLERIPAVEKAVLVISDMQTLYHGGWAQENAIDLALNLRLTSGEGVR